MNELKRVNVPEFTWTLLNISELFSLEDGPKAASVLRNYQTISGDIIEKEDTSMTIPLNCSSGCNPPCEVAWYKDGQLESRGNPVIKITRDRRMSGVYQCEASGVEGKVKSAQVHLTIQCKLFVILYILLVFKKGGLICVANETQNICIQIVRNSGYL